MSRTLLALDTETHKIVPGLLAPPMVVASYCLGEAGGERIDWQTPLATWRDGKVVTGLPSGLATRDDGGFDLLRSALLDDDLHLVFHNGAFDLAVVAAHDPDMFEPIFAALEAGRISDTMIREKLIRLALGELSSDFGAGSSKQTQFGMAEVFFRRWGIDMSAEKAADAWRTRYAELDGVPLERWPAEARDYPVRDAERTMCLFFAQGQDTYSGVVDDEGWVTNESEQVAAAFALHLSACWGERTDAGAVGALAQRLEENVREAREALTDIGIFRAKDGSKDTKKLKEVIVAAFESAGLAAPKVKRKGKNAEQVVKEPGIATDKDVLLTAPADGQPRVWLTDKETGERKQVPALRALAGISADEHNKATYIPAMLYGTQAPINPGINTLLESGRTSYFKPNLQNLPRKGGYRECFIPRQGWVYINTDYSGIELCALAQFCLDAFGHSEMAKALESDKDLHLDMAAEILGIPYEEAVRRKKEKEVKDARQMSKALNFGLPGGLGAETAIVYARTAWNVSFAEKHEDAVEVVKRHKQTWLRKWPEMNEFFAYVSTLTNAGGGKCVVSQPRSGRKRGDTGYCDGCNTHFQGLAADGAKAALFFIAQEQYAGWSKFWSKDEHEGRSPLFGSRQTIFVHDEFIGQALVPHAAEAAQRLVQVALEGMRLYIDQVPVKAEPVLMRRWYKDAEPVYDADGVLIPWEPDEVLDCPDGVTAADVEPLGWTIKKGKIVVPSPFVSRYRNLLERPNMSVNWLEFL